MNGDLVERIKACIEVERKTAELYNAFGIRFPEAMSFFYGLSKEEENHATLLSVAMAYNDIGKLPERVVPGPLSDIHATLNLLKNIESELNSREITLKEAVEIAESIENSMAEIYLPETLVKESDDKVVLNLRKLLVDEKMHIEKINDFKDSRGIQ